MSPGLGMIVVWPSDVPSFMPNFIGHAFLTDYPDIFGGLVFLIVGILVIALLITAAAVLLPAIIIAAFLWFLTGSFLFAGVSFLVVAVVCLAAIVDD